MEEKKKIFIMRTGLLIFVLLIFISSLSLTFALHFDKIIAYKNDEGILVPKDYNQTLILVFAGFIILFGLIISLSYLIDYFKNKKLENLEKSDLKTAIIRLVFGTLVFVFNLFLLFFIPIKRNSLKWGMALSSVIFATLIILITIYNLFFTSKENQENNLSVNTIAEAAIAAASAVVFSLISDMIPFLRLSTGGGVSLSMLPIFLISYRRGFKTGIITGFIYGLANLLIDGFIIHAGSIFFDYLIPFSLLGVAGLFAKKAQAGNLFYTILGVLLGGFLRYISHSFSGVLFFSSYAPENMNPWFYSFIFYNLPYMLISTALALIIILLIRKRLIITDTKIV